MSPKDLLETITALLPTKRPLFVWGPPGVGKSDIIHEAARNQGLAVLDLRAVLLDPVDLRGLPHVNGDKRAVWCPPSFIPVKGTMGGKKGVIFADELPQAPPLVQAAFLQGILDHRIGEVELDPDWQWIAAGNRTEDRAGTHRMITPLLNRFGHVDLDVNTDDWGEWAVKHGIAPEVRQFIRFRPGLLHKFDATSQERAFPTPRSWAFVSNVLPSAPARLLVQIVAGFVGQGPAAEFVAFHRMYHELPDVDALVKDPSGFKPPTDPAILWALSGALVERVKAASAKTITNVFTLVNRIPDEYAILTVRDCAAVNRKFIDTTNIPAATDFLKKHRKVLANIS